MKMRWPPRPWAAIHFTSLSPNKVRPILIGELRIGDGDLTAQVRQFHGRLLDPFRRDDLLSAPRALVEHELTDLCGIARAETKARGRGNPFIPVFHPFPVGDAKRDEQRLACERLQRLARYTLNDVTEQVRSTAIVIPHRIRRRRDRLRQDIAVRVGLAAEMRFIVLRILPGAVLVPLNTRRHGQEMAKGDVVPTWRFQRRIIRKEFDDGLVGALDQFAIDRNPDQQRNHALRNRAHVVLGRRIEIVPPFAHSPGLVIAGEILLEHQFAVPNDDDGMDIGIAFLQPRGDAAQTRAVKADAFGRGGSPAIVERSRRSAGQIPSTERRFVRLRRCVRCDQ